MKRTLALACAAALSLPVAAETATKLESEKQKVGYSFGQMFGKRLQENLPEMDIDTFLVGIKDAYTNQKPKLSEAEIATLMQTYQEAQMKKQRETFDKKATENKDKGAAFLAENGKKDGVVTLESGLQYEVVNKGDGTAKPKIEDTVEVHYTGKLINGEVFDSSVERNRPATFPVKGVIPGWIEALQLMQKGDKWKLVIPSDLAYGPNGNGRIGPNETLVFDVELLDIKDKKAK